MPKKVTEVIPHDFDVLAFPVKWLQFLDDVFKGDDDAQQKTQLIQEWFGYCLDRGLNLHKALVLYGDGGNGKSVILDVLAVKSVLKETSILPLGADSSTSVNLAASAAAASKGLVMSFEDWVKSLGLDSSTMNPEQQAALQDAYNHKMQVSAGEHMPAEKKPEPMAAVAPTTAAAAAQVDLMAGFRQGLAAEHRRASAINAAAGGFHDIAATAIEQGWSVEKTELEALKRQTAQSRTRPTSFTAAQGNGDQTRILQAALSVARGHKAEKHFTDAELQAAHSQYRGRVGLQQVIIQAAAANGMPIHVGSRLHDGNLREALQYASGQNLQAAFSTVSLPGIFSNLANKELDPRCLYQQNKTLGG